MWATLGGEKGRICLKAQVVSKISVSGFDPSFDQTFYVVTGHSHVQTDWDDSNARFRLIFGFNLKATAMK